MDYDQDFGNYHQRKLKAAMQRTPDAIPTELREAVDGVLWFLDRRLTDAAKAGCHHCGEGDRGIPCWWCGLRNRGR